MDGGMINAKICMFTTNLGMDCIRGQQHGCFRWTVNLLLQDFLLHLPSNKSNHLKGMIVNYMMYAFNLIAGLFLFHQTFLTTKKGFHERNETILCTASD